MCPASQDQHRKTKQLQEGKMNKMTSCTQNGTVRPQIDMCALALFPVYRHLQYMLQVTGNWARVWERGYV